MNTKKEMSAEDKQFVDELAAMDNLKDIPREVLEYRALAAKRLIGDLRKSSPNFLTKESAADLVILFCAGVIMEFDPTPSIQKLIKFFVNEEKIAIEQGKDIKTVKLSADTKVKRADGTEETFTFTLGRKEEEKKEEE